MAGHKQRFAKHTKTASVLDPKLVVASLQADAVALAQQLHALELENGRLSLRQKVLTGLWLASRQAVKILESSVPWGFKEDVKRAIASAQALETLLVQSVETDCHQMDPLKPWSANLQPSPGTASELLFCFVDAAKVSGPSELSVLGGAPCSLMLAVLLCLQYDPQFIQRFRMAWGEGPEALAAGAAKSYAQATQELLVSLDRAASVLRDSQESVQVLSSIAVQFLCLARGIVSGAVLFPTSSVSFSHFMKGEDDRPPDAKLDEIADNMLITQEQVLSMLKEQSMYNEILTPLAKEKSELLASISQALAAGNPQPPAETAAAAGRASLLPLPADRPASWVSSTLGDPQAAAAGFGGLPFSETSHSELLQQLSRVEEIETQLWWLDMCCSFSCFGKFNWWQLGTMVANFHPYPPGAPLLARRLVTRTSIMLLLPGLPCPRVQGPYLGGSAAPCHVAGVQLGAVVPGQRKEEAGGEGLQVPQQQMA